MPTRIAAASGLLAPLTYGAALLLGGWAQPDDFSSADDATSDLGATTASSPWIYNQIGMNLTGILIVVFALGLWRALSPDFLGRVGAVGLVGAGVTLFLEGFLRLDCQGIDVACDNTSWYSDGHRLTTALSGLFILGSPIVLALAFRRLADWHTAWLPTLAAIPAFFLASILFSVIGDGAATRAGAVTWFLWLAYVAFQLLKKAEEREPELLAAR